jgi:hypothetical protein
VLPQYDTEGASGLQGFSEHDAQLDTRREGSRDGSAGGENVCLRTIGRGRVRIRDQVRAPVRKSCHETKTAAAANKDEHGEQHEQQQQQQQQR